MSEAWFWDSSGDPVRVVGSGKTLEGSCWGTLPGQPLGVTSVDPWAYVLQEKTLTPFPLHPALGASLCIWPPAQRTTGGYQPYLVGGIQTVVNPERFFGTEPTCINLFKGLPEEDARHTVGASPGEGVQGLLMDLPSVPCIHGVAEMKSQTLHCNEERSLGRGGVGGGELCWGDWNLELLGP